LNWKRGISIQNSEFKIQNFSSEPSKGAKMFIPGTESLLCVVLLLLGSAGLFVLFLATDNNAVDESKLPEHANEKRDEVSNAR
jgi:hypothetical protein